MNTLLRIDSSLRTKGSYSRTLGDYFIRQWQTKNPEGIMIERDVTRKLIPHITQETVDAFFSEIPDSENIELSDELINELYQCNEILITCPMYNYGIPSSLKAYFDLVIRTKKTFAGSSIPKGLLANKKAYIISSMGGISTETLNPLENHLTQLLSLMGITEISYFPLDGTVDQSRTGEKILIQQSEILKQLNAYATDTTNH
ncbi:FMN-dependent NADH-azoreductase [Chryseobacterium sp. YR221]|uniref:FMN-dependent NADH-azoreductase n=1 Tax=Chryseobacterium sp. YR221 TaxID=1500293 RepID=UPI0009D7EBDD|nr:NAD(P)H-dependent oxidoreductase [Chryseobacterium sp. YR221]SMC39906.1 FMN-dependent NADH-azoreductase [Chryseobacterium sp. YR221]